MLAITKGPLGACSLLAAALVAGIGCTAVPGETNEAPDPPKPGGRGGTGGTQTTPPGMGGAPGVTNPSAVAPGRVTIRRLNRLEYDNTVRDLLGLDLKPSRMFEFIEDEWGDGFNNDADVLTLSPISIEKYLTAAQFLINKALDPANAMVRSRIMVCEAPATPEAECGKRIVGDFARRAFRRTVSAEDLAPYLGLIDKAKTEGETFEVGIKTALAGILVAPDFLFRIEVDAMRGAERALDNFELASRLSYFIWGSTPDDELLRKAEQGGLTSNDEISKQVGRMLGDQRTASGFTAAMVEQWMQTIALGFAEPDVKFFATWQPALRAAMEQEVRALMGPVLLGQVSAQELLTPKYVHVNRALAQYYGLPNAAGLPTDRFDKVMLNDDRRGGVLRQGSFLVLTSHPDTHAPTRRGKWILERLLCEHPPAPPAMIPAFQPTMIQEGTLRQKLEKTHVAMGGSCQGCHAFIDPMGFALEHYDGSGSWRDKDNNLPIDATGTMPKTGEKFDGAAQLSELIAKDPRFPACMAKHVLTYALGRKMGDADKTVIDDLGKKFSESGYKVPRLVELVAQSPLMTRRQAEKE